MANLQPESGGERVAMNSKMRILVVDDEVAIREVLSASLADDGFDVVSARSGEEALRMIDEYRPHAVLLDIWMPGSLDGIDVLRVARTKHSTTEFVIMSGHGTIETAVKAVKLGAWDFGEKPLSFDKISILLNNIRSFQSERGEKQALLNRLRKNIALVGESAHMVRLKHLIARVAPSSSWVLISGENGTGKELVAQNIHYLSPRAGFPLAEVNCAGIPEDLVESELFGHEKGAFAGLAKSRRGKLEHAQGGTLFLDEIAALNLENQEKLLRVLQEGHFKRVGGEEVVEADVRVLAATSKNLEQEIKEGRFRQDLFNRLNVIACETAPLRDRAEDIPALTLHFSEQFAREGAYRRKTFSEQAAAMLRTYSWPGNVRELRNFIERVYILTPGDFVDVHDLKFAGLRNMTLDPVQVNRAEAEGNVDGVPDGIADFREARARFEREYLLKKIAENRGNISKTAEAIGLERSYLHRKIKSYGIEADEIS